MFELRRGVWCLWDVQAHKRDHAGQEIQGRSNQKLLLLTRWRSFGHGVSKGGLAVYLEGIVIRITATNQGPQDNADRRTCRKHYMSTKHTSSITGAIVRER